ncbi:nucleotidyltransferase domain-containing protein [Deefgea tanakiae]|uniref:Nucleotidyltransferase domain-containing protein n=1 Tax=Deefgea tanakiae TaxID=2865840 RepID=A0ABX8Z6E5_9NEIS|nr:nucleotidyltransferase domain-containing protein [Deefgea tanakiae]QZA78131.1 nucleotidyltransferase domain-containing protein [Deefgea tanakiae]
MSVTVQNPSISLPLASILAQLQSTYPNLLAVYLFGSFAKGEAHAQSDVDLAVLLAGNSEPVALWEVGQAIATVINRDVDLIDLRQASTVMQYQVITQGQRLWARDSQAAIFESFILSEKTNLDTARAGVLTDIGQRGNVYG